MSSHSRPRFIPHLLRPPAGIQFLPAITSPSRIVGATSSAPGRIFCCVTGSSETGRGVYRWDFDPEEPESSMVTKIQFPPHLAPSDFSSIFQSEDGKQVLASTPSANSFLISRDSESAVHLGCLEGAVVEAVLWVQDVMLVGTQKGEVLVVKEEKLEARCKLGEERGKSEKVLGIASSTYVRQNQNYDDAIASSTPLAPPDIVRLLFFATPSRLYLLCGVGPPSSLFSKPPKVFLEAPKGEARGNVIIRDGTLTWMNGGGVAVLKMRPGGPATPQQILERPHQLLVKGAVATFPFPPPASADESLLVVPSGPPPRQIVVTDHHIGFLYDAQLLVLSSVSGELVSKVPLPPSQFGGPVQWLSPTLLTNSRGGFDILLWSSKKLLRLAVEREAGDVWSHYLRKKDYNMAVLYAQRADAGTGRRDAELDVRKEVGESLMRKGEVEAAAENFALAVGRASFENVALRFIEGGHRKALVRYLDVLLRGGTEEARGWTPPPNQAALLFVLGVEQLAAEVGLGRCNASCDDEDEMEMESLLYRFFAAHFGSLPKSMSLPFTFQLLKSSLCPPRVVARVAEIGGEVEKALEETLERQDCSDEQKCRLCLKILAGEGASIERDSMLLKFSAEFFRLAPGVFVEALVSDPCWATIDPSKMLDTLSLSLHVDTSDDEVEDSGKSKKVAEEAAIRFLRTVSLAHRAGGEETDEGIEQAGRLLTSLIARRGEEELLEFFGTEVSNRDFDAAFAREICAERRFLKAEVFVLGKLLKEPELAVDKALEAEDVSSAIEAIHEASPALRRSLWLRLLHWQGEQLKKREEGKWGRDLDKEQTLEVGGLLGIYGEAEGELEIMDVLPYLDQEGLPSITNLSGLRSDILATLDKLEGEVEEWGKEMEDHQEALKKIKVERSLCAPSSRSVALSLYSACELCRASVFSRQFYVWPCGHCAHHDCQRRFMVQGGGMTSEDRKKMEEVEQLLEKFMKSTSIESQHEDPRKSALESSLDDLLAGDCPICGDVMVKVALDTPFVDPLRDQEELLAWHAALELRCQLGLVMSLLFFGLLVPVGSLLAVRSSDSSCVQWATKCGGALRIRYENREHDEGCLLKNNKFCLLNGVAQNGTPITNTDCVESMKTHCHVQTFMYLCYEIGGVNGVEASNRLPRMRVRFSSGQLSQWLEMGNRRTGKVEAGSSGCYTLGDPDILGFFDMRQNVDALAVTHHSRDALGLKSATLVTRFSVCDGTLEGCLTPDSSMLSFVTHDYPVSRCAEKYDMNPASFIGADGWTAQKEEEVGKDGVNLSLGIQYEKKSDPFGVPEVVFYVNKEGGGVRAAGPSCSSFNAGYNAVAGSLVGNPGFVTITKGEERVSAFRCASDETCFEASKSPRSRCFFDASEHPFGRCRVQVGLGEPCGEGAEGLCSSGLLCKEGTCWPKTGA